LVLHVIRYFSQEDIAMTVIAFPSAPRALSLAVGFALIAAAEARAEFKATPALATINAHYAYARGLDGRGQAIGVLDTGVHPGHPELAGRVFGVVMQGLDKAGKPCESGRFFTGDNACFRTDGSRPMVMYGYLDEKNPKVGTVGGYDSHGTHVAGTMVAARNGKDVHGVAPEAKLFSLTLAADVYISQDLKALTIKEPPNEAIAQGYAGLHAAKVRAINHSWGFENTIPASDAVVDAQFQKYRKRIDPIAAATLKTGLIQVWAAGNASGATADVLPALPRYLPALEPHWLSVVSASADGKLDDFSSRCGLSREWCVAAPGNDIPSTTVGDGINVQLVRDAQGRVVGFNVPGQQKTFHIEKESGTSMAAPHVTASLALVMQRFPYLHNAAIRDVLLTTARDLGAPGVDDIFGWGMIDLRKAIDGPGQLRVDTKVNMDRPGGGTPVWTGPAWDDWRNAIGGSGRLIKQGPGWLRLSGNNRFGGATVDGGTLEFTGDNALSAPVTVNAGGALRVSGRMAGSALNLNGGQAWIGGDFSGADVQLQQGARLRLDGKIDGRVEVGARSRLEGNGQAGPTRIAGTIAPGHSIGTLTIAGDYVQQPGSVYEAEVGPAGRSDLVQVQGQAQLQGGTLRLVPTAAGTALGQRWRVLAASRGVSGQFAAIEGALPATPFLALSARYASDAVDAQVGRGLPLASAARTPNQRSVATAVDATPDAHPLPQRLTQLQPWQLPGALDPLSGELHASLRALLLQDSQGLRDAALARARDGQDAFSAQAATDAGHGLWADIQQGQRRLDGDGNADAARLSGNTALAGYDHAFDSGWRAGLLGGAGRSSAQLRARQDRAEVKARHAGLHVGRHWGGWAARAGIAHSWQDVRTRRQAADTTAQARYDVATSQWFAELGYRFERDRGGIEPFLQYAGLHLRSDGAQERDSQAALAIARARQNLRLWTGGMRFGVDLAARGQQQQWLSLRGSLAYQRANGDLTPTARMQWQQGPGFTVWGVPLARRSTLAALGIAARLSPRSLLQLDWRGTFASHARDHGVGARYSLRF